MKKYWILALLVPFFCFTSCVEDTSAYDPQDKEQVDVDEVENEQGDIEEDDDNLPEGKLVPGIHLVKLNIEGIDGQTEQRRFKYFMPISIDESKPISLIFEFHGSWEFDAGITPEDPIQGISMSNALIQHAIKENCVICFPAGRAEYQDDTSGAVNWQKSESHLPFVDAMIDYFKQCTPSVDMNRVYSTGQSSGAIFSFYLAFERPHVFAAITPRAGQMSLAGSTVMPVRAVPVRVFAGIIDDIVNHDAVIQNMTSWAERIGGYFASDMVLTEDSIEVEDYEMIDTRIWSGGKTDYQIFSIHNVGHGVSLPYCLPYMWEFMESHTLDNAAVNLFVTSSIRELDVQCGQTVDFSVNYTDGAEFSITAPKGWTLTQDGKNMSLKAPTDFFGAIDRKGNIKLTVTMSGKTATKNIPYSLQAPKAYFEVGDIYYNEAFEPIGVIYWVNDENIKEGRAISLKQSGITLGNLPIDFVTPDENDGYVNTQSVVEKNENENLGLTASNSAFIWAAQYGGETGWYLPSINELAEFCRNKAVINNLLSAAGGRLLPTAYCVSSTTVLNGARKIYMEYNFSGNYVSNETSMYNDPGFAIKKVTKK